MAGIAPPFQVPKVHISSHFSPPPGVSQAQKRRLRGEAPDDSAAPKTITLQELELLIKQNKKQ